MRTEGKPATGDIAADEAYDYLGATWRLYHDVYERDSIDGASMPLTGGVHYGKDYDNAFWNGEQMVFGDGDGEVMNRFTIAVDIIGHELTHGVIDHEAGLVYQGQPGALNESICDVFGVLVKQHSLRQTAQQADWLIGAGLFMPSVKAKALRSMAEPGTAYDDPVIGKDPQPAHMKDFVTTSQDNGGVHINSGIPNRAFYLAAMAIGGQAWETAGRVWYDAVCDKRLRQDADFEAFATLSTDVASRRFGAGSAVHKAVADAWRGRGSDLAMIRLPPLDKATIVRVTREGGAGLHARPVAAAQLPARRLHCRTAPADGRRAAKRGAACGAGRCHVVQRRPALLPCRGAR